MKPMQEAKQMTTVKTVGAASHTLMDFSIAVRVGRKSVSSRSSLHLNEASSSFFRGAFWVLEPDDGKPSSPVLRGLGASNGARLLDPWDYFPLARDSGGIPS